MTEIYIATEDALSEAVADRLVKEFNPGLRVAVRMRRKGNGYLKKKLYELNDTARTIPVLLLTDLDLVECPPALINEWRGQRVLAKGMIFRVVVREIEAWLLADREGFAGFSGAPVEKVPPAPESLDDPKSAVLNLVRRYGSRELKKDILPARGASATVGLGYNQALGRFVQGAWSIARASTNADSLARAYRRVRNFSVDALVRQEA